MDSDVNPFSVLPITKAKELKIADTRYAPSVELPVEFIQIYICQEQG